MKDKNENIKIDQETSRKERDLPISSMDMYGIRLPHIFETSCVSIYKPSILNKTLGISSRNLGCQSKHLVLLINNL